MKNFSTILSLALLVDIVLGDPRSFPHPVSGIGHLIKLWETRLYKPTGRARGALFCFLVIACTLIIIGLVLLAVSWNSLLETALHVYLLTTAIAWRSLKDQTLTVAVSLFHRNLIGARSALSMVVGRDTDDLTESAIVRAAVETIAENEIDGIISVIFFAAVGWTVGNATGMTLAVWAFKAASTMDSMVGYNDNRYHDFGFCAAKLDDIFNFVPARLGGVVIVAAGGCLGHSITRGFSTFLRDRKKHESPNSAHGESAFAGLLGIRLGGGAKYHGIFESKPYLGDNTREAEPADILRSHRILDASVALFALLVIVAFFPL